jgi:hypothetical protein
MQGAPDYRKPQVPSILDKRLKDCIPVLQTSGILYITRSGMSNEIHNFYFLPFFTITINYYYTEFFTDQVYSNTSMYLRGWCFLAAEQNQLILRPNCVWSALYVFTNMQTEVAW